VRYRYAQMADNAATVTSVTERSNPLGKIISNLMSEIVPDF
jgi:hypothetical protein